MLEHPQTPLHWQHFAESHGKPDIAVHHITRFGYYTMVIRAALAGQGMALIPRGLILDELETGRLISPNGFGYRSEYGYWFAKPEDISPGASMRTFEAWLMGQAESMRD